MTSSFKVILKKGALIGHPDLGHGRADYTTDIISNVNVTVQSDRLSAVVFSDINTVVTPTATLPTTTSVYDSGWQEVGDFLKVRGHMHSDTAGTIYIEQSSMTATTKTVHVQTTQAYLAGSEAGGFIEDVVATYVRVRFIPTVNPTTFVSWARLSN